MAIGEDALEGLDLSVLQSIATDPTKDAKEDKDDSPSIFEPQLKIQEVDEVPVTEKGEKEESKKEVEPSAEEAKEVVEDEPADVKAEDKEEPVSGRRRKCF